MALRSAFFPSLAIVATALTAPATPASAQGRQVSYDTYGDWRASVMQVESSEESWRECRASTGGDGLPSLSVEFRQYDAGPPDFFPPVEIRESAARGYKTQMQQGGQVTFTFDDGERYAAIARNDIAEGVFQTATASPDQSQTLSVLQGMRRAVRLDIAFQGNLVLSASLKGFTAAYGKVAEACGFSTVGVISALPDSHQSNAPRGDAGDTGTLLFEQFDHWRAQAEDFESDGTIVRECTASVPADKDRRLSFGWNALEAAPPDSFPPLILSEAISESIAPMVGPDARIRFAFDTGMVLPGAVMTYLSQDGIRYIDLVVQPGYRDVALRELTRAGTLRVTGDGSVIYQTPVSGFAKTYSAIARVCEFTTNGVLN